MTNAYQNDNKGEQSDLDKNKWGALEKFFIFLIFSAKEKSNMKFMKRCIEKVLPLFDFLDHTTSNKLGVIRKLFNELDDESKIANLSLN